MGAVTEGGCWLRTVREASADKAISWALTVRRSLGCGGELVVFSELPGGVREDQVAPGLRDQGMTGS